MPLVSRTRATFRRAEFGFLGVEVYTRVQTPRFCGQLSSAGLEVFHFGGFRPIRTSWLNVGTNLPLASVMDACPLRDFNSVSGAIHCRPDPRGNPAKPTA